VDLGQASIVAFGNLQLEICALIVLQVCDRDGVWTCHQPVVNETVLKLVVQIVHGVLSSLISSRNRLVEPKKPGFIASLSHYQQLAGCRQPAGIQKATSVVKVKF
jgi:hypothetical protein